MLVDAVTISEIPSDGFRADQVETATIAAVVSVSLSSLPLLSTPLLPSASSAELEMKVANVKLQHQYQSVSSLLPFCLIFSTCLLYSIHIII